MNKTVNLVTKIKPELKKTYYDLCHSIGLTPMRTTLILIERFASGKIDALPVLQNYKDWKYTEKYAKTKRLLKYRIDGSESKKTKVKDPIDKVTT